MNALEKTILKSSFDAMRTYSKMSDGGWLSDGPEHFLQTVVACAVWHGNNNRRVLIDTPYIKIAEWTETLNNLRPRDERQRPDIFITNASWVPRAVIEIKTKGNNSSIDKDAEKIERHFEIKGHATAGYLLIFFLGWKLPGRKAVSLNLRCSSQIIALHRTNGRWSVLHWKKGGTRYLRCKEGERRLGSCW
jgi:hypothetical protein